MKAPRLPAILALSLFLSGCSSLDVKSGAAPGASFADKKTFAFFEAPAGLIGRTPAQEEFLAQRVNPIVKAELMKKGYVPASRETADLLIATQVSVDGTVDAVRWGYTFVGWDPWGGAVGGAYATSKSYKTGMLVYDIVESKGKSLVFRGWAKDVLRVQGGDKTHDDIVKITAKMLEQLPPVR